MRAERAVEQLKCEQHVLIDYIRAVQQQRNDDE